MCIDHHYSSPSFCLYHVYDPLLLFTCISTGVELGLSSYRQNLQQATGKNILTKFDETAQTWAESIWCMLHQVLTMCSDLHGTTSSTCERASNTCESARNTCERASNMCERTSNMRERASNTCEMASNTCERASSTCERVSNTCESKTKIKTIPSE